MNLYTWFAVRCCSITELAPSLDEERFLTHICETNLAQIVVILVTVLTQQVFLVILEDTEVSLAAVTFDIFCVWTHFKC